MFTKSHQLFSISGTLIRTTLLLLFFLLVACTPAQTPVPTDTLQPPTLSPLPTDTPSPFPTATSTPTPLPTGTPLSTNTPSPTPTAEILEVTPSPAIEPPPGFKQYKDSVVGVSVFVPENWVVTEVVPGRSAILQSYPEGKYIGGEAFEPGDTKCDLTIRPPDIDVASQIQQLKSDPFITIVSEQEIVLQSGKPGTRIEVESMGRSVSLITDVSGRAIVLACFGELVPFDEIAVTLSESE